MKHPAFWPLACREPYRIFFPMGLVIGVIGVSLWPLFYLGLLPVHPGIIHARLMVEGFLGGFIFGFLGTAGPRLSGATPFSRCELGLLSALYLGVIVAHALRLHSWGDGCFLASLVVLMTLIGRRLLKFRRLPAPGFALVGFGFLCAVLGLLGMLVSGALPPRAALLANTLLNEAWVLYLVLGVGSFLFPMLLQIPPQPSTLRCLNGTRGALIAGGTLLFLYLADLWLPFPRVLAGLRFLLVAGYLISTINVYRGSAPRATMVDSILLGMSLLIAGILFPVIWPGLRVAGLHLLFVGGFATVTIAVATRVVLAHGGLRERCDGRLLFLTAAVGLFLVGLLLRIGADIWLPWRNPAIIAGGLCWIAGALIWGGATLPKVRQIDEY